MPVGSSAGMIGRWLGKWGDDCMPEESWFRAIVGGIVLLSGAVYLFHRLRNDSRSEKTPENVRFRWGRPVGALFLFGPVIWYVFAPESIDFARLPLPLIVREFCGVSAVGGLVLLHLSLQSLGKNTASTTSTTVGQELVTAGAYRWMRHPLYGSAFYLLVGCAFLSSNALLFIAAVLLFFSLRLVLIPEEERHLRREFGPAFEDYCRDKLPLFPKW